jgi:hypothetical protein
MRSQINRSAMAVPGTPEGWQVNLRDARRSFDDPRMQPVVRLWRGGGFSDEELAHQQVRALEWQLLHSGSTTLQDWVESEDAEWGPC